MRSILLLSFLLVTVCSFAQDSKSEKPDYRVTVGVNFRNPNNKSLKEIYPFLHFKKNSAQQTALGGITVGLSRFFPVRNKIDVKTSLNASRQVYWNDPFQFNKGPNPQDKLGIVTTKSVEYYLSGSGIVHFNFGRFSPGLGLGFEGLIVSTRKFPKNGIIAGTGGNLKDYRNREYKFVMPVVPVEVSWKGDLMLYNLRYEAGLLNRFRKDLADSGNNFYGVLSLEVGIRI